MGRVLLFLLLPGLLLTQGKASDTTELVLSTTVEGLTVRAARIPHGELATTEITQLQVYRNATAKADPLLAVNSLPAATNPEETANVSLRGSPAEATGVYLNGVPLRSAVRIDQSNGVGQFSLFRQLPLRTLRVYPSSPPLPFSQASAGAVAIETTFDRPGATQHGLSLNVAGVGYSHTQPVGPSAALRGYVNVSDLTLFRTVNGSKLEDLHESRAVDGMLSYVTKGAAGNGLQLFYLGFDERYVYDYRTESAPGQFRQHKPRHLAVANYDWTGGDWHYRLNQLVDWERPTFQFDGRELTYTRTTNHSALHAERRLPGWTLQWGTAVNNYFDPDAHRYTGEAYVYVQRQTGPWLFGGGLKPVYDGGEAAANVQLAARIRLGAHRVNLSGGSHTQLLAPGRSFPDWQRLRIRQLALEHRFDWGSWRWESAVYAKREHYARAGAVAVVGGEGQLTYRNGPWLVSTALTAVRSRGAAPTARDIPVALRGQLQYDLGGWSVGLSYRGRSGQFIDPLATNPDRYPHYRRLDAALSKTFITKLGALILYVNANNLLDTENVSHYSYRGEEYYSRRVVFFGGVLNW